MNVHTVGWFKADVEDAVHSPFCSFVKDLEDSKVSFHQYYYWRKAYHIQQAGNQLNKIFAGMQAQAMKNCWKTWQLKVEISLWSAHLFSMLWCINCLCCICFHQINLLSMEHNFDIVSIWISHHTLSHLATCTLYVFKCWVSLLRQCLLYICWLSEIFADESWLSSINLPDGSSPKINSCSSGSSACVYREGMTSGAMNG